MSRSPWPDRADGSTREEEPSDAPLNSEPERRPGPAFGYTTAPEGGRRWPWVVGVVASLIATTLVAAAVAANFIEVPYFALRPGAVRDVDSAVAVDEVDTYVTGGSINYTTVSIRQMTALEYITGHFDSDVEIVPEEEILGDRDVDQNRERNLQLMDSSQQDAAAVALEVLGYEVDATLEGYIVRDVLDGYPVSDVLDRDDLIIELDGHPIDHPGALEEALDQAEPGDVVDIVVQPHHIDGTEVEVGEPEERTLELSEAPDEDRAILGVLVERAGPRYNFPIGIQFDTGDVGGPSAGLAFSLALIDLLSPGELTGGLDVAVTGSLSWQGTVGPVGGTPQKVVAARQAGMDVFIVPAGIEELDEVIERAGDDIEVIPVSSIDEALDALAERGGDPVEELELDEAA